MHGRDYEKDINLYNNVRTVSKMNTNNKLLLVKLSYGVRVM